MEQRGGEWDATKPAGHWLASNHLGDATSTTDFRIDGWLAARGTSVWFGPGSTGKTQLLLWMAALIASKARPAQWLGREVHGTGHVLILSAEDSREHIIGRLRDVLLHTLGQDEQTAQATCDRLHVMPFLSMTEEEFTHPNASLMQPVDHEWEPSPVLLEIRRYIKDWNRRHEAPDDKIVGVVMDSATSMAGFDSIDGHATTNFFFYLGRLCEALNIFWTVIGHQPKSVIIGKDTRLNAAARLRGAAMWTTAPRMTVEVRLIQEWNRTREADHIRAAYPDRSREDFVVVYVAKANLPGVHKEERYILRSAEGAFTDVTAPPPFQPATNKAKRVAVAESRPRDSAEAAAEPAPRPQRDWSKGTALVSEAIQLLHPELKPGTIIAADKTLKFCREHFAGHADLDLIKSAHGGKEIASREGAINWHLERLAERGILTRKNDRFRLGNGPGGERG